ncbi:unnamed protein product [Allacma fusca]|uniref:Ig-like domain-containing protein n=1 Tax=Allacma fusca TaxID=39272 RepID=A0A8J2KGB3_9HEXA|nr:unnamed protein product [Allacma fusca]
MRKSGVEIVRVMEWFQNFKWIFLLIVLTDSGHASDGGNRKNGMPLMTMSSLSSWSSTLPPSPSSLPSLASTDGKEQAGRKNSPYIDKLASPNVTALLGKTAYLNCRVKNLGDKTVSWVRHRDIHLLTVGRYTYTTDQRFRALHIANTEDYTLMIKYPQHRDSGIYECQVSTTPHISHYVHLNVVGEFIFLLSRIPTIHSAVSVERPPSRRKVSLPLNPTFPQVLDTPLPTSTSSQKTQTLPEDSSLLRPL